MGRTISNTRNTENLRPDPVVPIRVVLLYNQAIFNQAIFIKINFNFRSTGSIYPNLAPGFQVFLCRIGIEGHGEIVVTDGVARSNDKAVAV